MGKGTEARGVQLNGLRADWYRTISQGFLKADGLGQTSSVGRFWRGRSLKVGGLGCLCVYVSHSVVSDSL